MSQVTSFVICFLMGALRSRLSLQLEVAALRHQLSMYQETQRRPPISSSDRLLWSMIANVWSGCPEADSEKLRYANGAPPAKGQALAIAPWVR